jgi:hypothetical protein
VKHVLAWLSWWVPLFFGWLLLAGEWNRQELVAAAGAATIAASVAEFSRARIGFGARVPLRALADAPQVLLMVFVDFGIVMGALLAGAGRGRFPRGEFVRRALDRPEDAEGTGARAWTALAASYSPNAYVLEIGAESGEVLFHDLRPRRSSESPA